MMHTKVESRQVSGIKNHTAKRKCAYAGIWKILILSLFSLLLFITLGCQDELDTIMYEEQHDAANNTQETAENAGNLAAPLSITGSISSADDVDYFRVSIPSGSSTLTYHVYYNGEEELSTTDSLSYFPLSLIEYSGNDAVILISPFAAGYLYHDISSGVSYIMFQISGNDDYSSGDYELLLDAE